MSKRILVVEDEEDNLTLFIHILQRLLGHTVYLARDGHEAIEQAKAHNPDFILMDLTLPKLTGWEAARSLKGMAEFRTTPIIALTAHAMAGDRERALEAGCDNYYAKPIDVDTFLAFLEPYVRETVPSVEPASTPAPAEAVTQATPASDQAVVSGPPASNPDGSAPETATTTTSPTSPTSGSEPASSQVSGPADSVEQPLAQPDHQESANKQPGASVSGVAHQPQLTHNGQK
jgi:two-component system, cell cycle response regulator DivK